MSEDVIRAFIQALQRVKGIKAVRVLSEEERQRVLELEAEAERRALMGLMPGKNLGVREAVARRFVLAAIIDMEFKWPDEPRLRLVCEGEEIGIELVGEDPEDMRRRGYVVIGNFAIKKDKMHLLRERRKQCSIEILPLKLSIPSEVKGIKDLVVGSPSPPADEYLKRLFEIQGEGLGTIIIGFNAED